MNISLDEIKKNLLQVKMQNDTEAVRIYMRLVVESAYVAVGNKYLTKEEKKQLDKNSFVDVDENGVDENGFDFCMDESELLENNKKKEVWSSIMKNRKTLEEAFEIILTKE